MLADAMFAQGVNLLIYHGTPYNPIGSDTIEFFATTYFGPNGSVTPELPALNQYVEKVSGIMQRGKTYTDVAVYLPYEDGVMQGAYPEEKQRVWVWGAYEMRYIYPPDETEGYHPLWINRHFLEQAQYLHHKLIVGDAQFSALYVDVKYMDIRALKKVLQFAQQGLPVCLKQIPTQPGKNISPEYDRMLNKLTALKNVSADFKKVVSHAPLLQGENLPEYWCRVAADGTMYLFIAQPLSKNLTYPLYSGQSFMQQPEYRDITINVKGKSIQQKITFYPYQSVMLKISKEGEVEKEDITFIPKDPVVRPKEPQKTYF
ncbi:MAG: glycosyl hydrolase [Chitinophagales bacterium]